MNKHFDWYYSVSHTTRKIRKGEAHGQDYFFVSDDDFQKMVGRNEFLEWAQVYQNRYGTSQQIIEDKLSSGQGVVVDVDTQGAQIIKQKMPEAILIFIKPPDVEELKKRLVSRGRDPETDIEKRLMQTQQELARMSAYDHVVVNDKLDRAVQEIISILNDK